MTDKPTPNAPESGTNSRNATLTPGDEARFKLTLGADLDRQRLAQVNAEASKFGLKVTENGQDYDFSYRAGGKDNVVLHRHADQDTVAHAPAILTQLVDQEIGTLERSYGVKFAKPGEDVERQSIRTDDCDIKQGEMIQAKQPTFSDLYAVDNALQRSSPSQFTEHGKDGIKIYFLDRQIRPQPVYGNKFALGMYIEADKDKKAALYVTPDGERLPATAADMDQSGSRNLTWVITHELTHNSQHEGWPTEFTPDNIAEQMGWKPVNKIEKEGKLLFENFLLKGRTGEYYANSPIGCGKGTAWVALRDNQFIDATGQLTADFDRAAHFTNEEVMDRAQVRPITYYFSNPKEMLSEALASYRGGKQERENLERQSPELYKTAQQYDQDEVARFYGTDEQGRPKYLRTPEGFIAKRDAEAEQNLRAFEKQISAPRT